MKKFYDPFSKDLTINFVDFVSGMENSHEKFSRPVFRCSVKRV